MPPVCAVTTEDHRLGNLQRTEIYLVLEAGTSKSMAPASGEGLHAVSSPGAGQKGKRGRAGTGTNLLL